MKKVLLILGNITFDHFEANELALFKTPDGRKALVHNIDGLIMCENKERAYAIGEEHVNEYDSYVIPIDFDGELVYQDAKARILVETFIHTLTELNS